MRITDGSHFIDCTLFGNYQISNNAIIETKNATTVTTFRRLQIVKLIDYFSKECKMPSERWKGYIKDYEGGTMMECHVHPTIDYSKISEIIKRQKEFVI